jgi:hypothetical protein
MTEPSRVYDPKRAAAAFDRLKPRLLEIPEKDIGTILVDLQVAAPVVLAVAELCATPKVRRLFDLLPDEVFDSSHLDELANLAWAGWYLRVQHLTALASLKGAQVPANVVTTATERKTRMLLVLEYFVGDDESAGPELASIRSGSGYLDLASDLTRLAALYAVHVKDIKGDKKRYHATDEADARADAATIIKHLGAPSKSAEKWMSYQLRLWHLLRISYEEVAAAGSYLFRHETLASRFPSLFTATRKPPRKRTASSVSGESTDPTPPA